MTVLKILSNQFISHIKSLRRCETETSKYILLLMVLSKYILAFSKSAWPFIAILYSRFSASSRRDWFDFSNISQCSSAFWAYHISFKRGLKFFSGKILKLNSPPLLSYWGHLSNILFFFSFAFSFTFFIFVILEYVVSWIYHIV